MSVRNAVMHDAVALLRDEIAAGRLAEADLTARGLSERMGTTTGALYHRHGSLDGLLYEVGQSAFDLLGARLHAAHARRRDLGDVAAAFVDFGLEQPVLYGLMFERAYDYDALRASGALAERASGLALFAAVVEALGASGATDPETDVRILFAGVVGLVSLAKSGRANVRALHRTDREVALECARELARRICPALCR